MHRRTRLNSPYPHENYNIIYPLATPRKLIVDNATMTVEYRSDIVGCKLAETGPRNSKMPRSLPPAGSPIQLREIANFVSHSLTRQSDLDGLYEDICEYLGSEYAFAFSNGRGAMSFLLSCLSKHTKDRRRDTVVIPSYTCYSVAASVLKAGLKVLICDIDEQTLSYDSEQINSISFDRVLAIVSTSLYGLPNDMTNIERLARDNGVFLIDDAAQSLGASIDGRKIGSFGDAGILSLDKGKNITSINGGILVTRHDSLARLFESEYARLESPGWPFRLTEIAKVFVYFCFLNPHLYAIPNSIPMLQLGKTPYDEGYKISRYFEAMAPLARGQLSRLESISKSRIGVADSYHSMLPKSDLLIPIRELGDSRPVYLRFPLRIAEQGARSRFISISRRLGCTVSYPTSISAIPQIKHKVEVQNNKAASGECIGSQIVTLPTHAYVRTKDVQLICQNLSQALSAPPSSRES